MYQELDYKSRNMTGRAGQGREGKGRAGQGRHRTTHYNTPIILTTNKHWTAKTGRLNRKANKEGNEGN